ncbi:MAG: hypothetical protein NZM31_13910 [Gemmatales bacterium]|nr:hypothetical protein [Gemmatales bacterium]MDW8388091.1 hypothetical protein [Gemmatales bacterium]
MSEMTGQAWLFMLGVWAFVAVCTGYCFWKLLTSPRRFGDAEEDNAPTSSSSDSAEKRS